MANNENGVSMAMKAKENGSNEIINISSSSNSANHQSWHRKYQ
jgi:hypothetical protein